MEKKFISGGGFSLVDVIIGNIFSPLWLGLPGPGPTQQAIFFVI